MTVVRTDPARALLWVFAVILAGCGPKAETSRPLIDEEHQAAVLVEQRVLSNPRSIEENRLLRGWRFVRSDNGLRLLPNAPESVIEIVHLARRPRRLVIDVAEFQPGDSVRVMIDGRSYANYPVVDRIEVDLPADLPLGRVAITLGFSNHTSTVVARLSISPSAAVGSAVIDQGVIEHAGWSALEIVHHVTAGARFTAEFHPPATFERGQRFAITAQREHQTAVEVFNWDSGRIVGDTESVAVDVPLGETPGVVRIHLLAEVRGPAARWVDPRIVEPFAAHGIGRTTLRAAPPRLVVLYVMDALRSDHIGRTGPRRLLTPVLDELAGDGVAFGRHFAVAPNTPPSTRALFSGLVMLDDRRLPVPGPTRLAEVFLEAGYRTASITGNPHLSPELDLGTGFESVDLLRVREDHNPDHRPTINRSAEILHAAAARWVDHLQTDERGFLYIHTMNPHNPYTPPPAFEARFARPGPSAIDGRTRTLVAIRDRKLDAGPGDIDRLRDLYAACVAYNDAELGVLMETIENRVDPEEILLIVTSDHGDELFEHGGVLHGYSLYDEMLRIPLIIHWPGRIEPGEISALTNTLDLHATLVELTAAGSSASTGRSLWPRLLGRNDPDPARELTFAAAPGLDGAIMARSDAFKLIFAPRGGAGRGQGKGRGRSWDLEYVFDLVNDPAEQHNLAGVPDLEVSWLRARLLSWVEAQRAKQPEPGTQIMDDEVKKQLEALGYAVER